MVLKADMSNLDEFAELAVLMWNEHTVQELKNKFSKIISQGGGQLFLKYCQNEPVGFAHCQIRHDYVEGTDSRPVGYLEGIFVKEGCRRKGYAKQLLSECEKWAKENGCNEFASDCEINNDVSFDFHVALGFKEANRIICFTKRI